MDHQEASRLLPDLLSGRLRDDRRAGLEAHLDECADCREWSETYDFLADALSGERETMHPSSEQLAHLAVDDELLTAPERDRLAAHLEGCADCRRELRLSHGALAAARREPSVLRFPLRLPTQAAPAWLALAASLILALAVAFFALRHDGFEPGPVTAALPEPEATEANSPEPSLAEAAPVEAIAPGGEPAVEALPRPPSPVTTPQPEVAVADAGDRPGPTDGPRGGLGTELPDVIDATAMAIATGSAVTLRAGEMVVLGEGFSIGSTATLGVQIANQSAAAPGSASSS